MDLIKLFNPKSIAIVGASPQQGKIGNVIAKNIIELGFAGQIHLVNPKYSEIFGKRCHRKLSELASDADLAIMAIPAELAILEIKENCDRIKNFVIISAGFSEIGEIGKKREEELVRLAEEKNINILGPNCLGFIVPSLRLNASFAGGMPEVGKISFVSQSGALAVAILDRARSNGLKFSSIISIGNKAQIDESAMLQHLASDENTKVIGMYLEGVKDGKKFMESARLLSKTKPIVILKSGKSEKSRQAISSHTGAMTGSDEIFSSVCKKTGIIRAENLNEFVDLLNLISNFDLVPRESATLITNAGGLGVLSADAFSGKSIKLSEPDESTRENLKAILPEGSSVKNPIDLLGDAEEDRYGLVLDKISQNSDPGTIICLLTPQDQTPVDAIASEIIKFKNNNQRNIIAVFLGEERVRAAVKKLGANGIPNFSYPDSAISALNKFYEWSQFCAPGRAAVKIDEKRQADILKIIKKAKTEKRKALYFSESREILEKYGIQAEKFLQIDHMEKIKLFNLARNRTGIKFPVAIKVDSDKIIHKTEKKGVILNIKDQNELDGAIAEMRRNFSGVRLIIQSMAKTGMEMIIGIKKDEIFGPVIVCGLGGIYAEIFKMIDNLVLPLNVSEIEKILLDGKTGFLFRDTRNMRPYDIGEMSRLILGISLLAAEISQIEGFDINPMVIYNDGEPAKILDVKILI